MMLPLSVPFLAPGAPAVPVADVIVAPQLSWAGAILLLPLLSLVLCGLCAAFRVKSKLPAVITAVCLAAAFVTSVFLYLNYEPPGEVVPLLDVYCHVVDIL